MSELLTIKELAEMLKVSRQTIYEWRKKDLPYIRIGSNVRFRLDDVNAWINKEGKGDAGDE